MARQHITLKKKLASALLTIVRPDETGKLVPVIDYEDAKKMSAEQIISCFHFDHGILHAIEPINEPWNLTPRPIIEHRKKSAKDKTALSKGDRLSDSQKEFQRKMLVKVGQGETIEDVKAKRKYKWPKRKMQSRNSFQRRKP
jgi:hypothetical protein